MGLQAMFFRITMSGLPVTSTHHDHVYEMSVTMDMLPWEGKQFSGRGVVRRREQ